MKAFFLVFALLFLVGACRDTGLEEPRRPYEIIDDELELPKEEPVKPVVEVRKPASAEFLGGVLPRVPREGKYRWSRKSKRVPGHFGAQLVEREGKKKSMLVVTVDDLRFDPARLKELRELDSRIGAFPGEAEPGAWIRALVSERYEVMVRANHPLFRSQDELQAWFDKLKFKALSKDPG